MAHLAPVTPYTAKPVISKTSPGLHKVCACTTGSDQLRHVQRRSIALGLAGVVVGLSVGGGNATAAARRPPPPPPAEKKDPNMNGVIAKVLASKKRKEAMKESIAKLRDNGKLIQEPSQ
ncbi:hypothetical protein CASFOL_034798 [Castilleja foliolosa]|uniref:Uncharacterized protein n=1 Tax=Castilleja foliolosa TaxID=1961234 RepID=A0ABD3BSE7_9LAMI